MPPQDPFDDIVKSYDSQAPKLPKPKPLATPSFDDIVNKYDQSASSVPTKPLSPRKQATQRNITGLQSELTATSPQPKPGETVDVSTGEMYKPSQPFHSPKLDYKPEGIAPKPQTYDNRTQRAARTARQIENTKRQAVQLFRQADQTPDTPDATGISGRQKLRAQAEGKVEGANELARRAQKDYGDLLEIGFGKDTDPNSRRQWAYAKAKTPTARAARDTVDLQAANAERFANPRGQLNQVLEPAATQNYRQRLNVRAMPKPEESELSPEEQNALAARHQVAEEARQQIAAQNPGAVSRAILGAGSVPVHALSGLASIPRRITGAAPGQLETNIGALGDVMAAGAQPTPETQGTFSAGNLGMVAGFIPTMALGGRVLAPITPATTLGSAISSGAQFANIAGGEGVSNREMARQGLIGGGVGAASELAGGAANRALAGKLANAELTPAQAAVAGRIAQGVAGGGAFAGQSALMGQRDPETLAKEALLGAAMGAAHSPRFKEAQAAARQQGINDIRQQIDRRSAMNEAAIRPQEGTQAAPAPMPARAVSAPNAQEPTEALTEPLQSATPPPAIPQLPAPENFNARRAKLLGIDVPPEVAINEQIQTADKLLNSPNEGDQRQGRALMNRALTAIRQSEGYLNETTATEGEKPYTATRAAIEARLKPTPKAQPETVAKSATVEPPTSASTGQRLIENTHARAMQMAESGDYTGAITELQSHQRALRDEKAKQMKAAKEPGRRVQIERDFNRQIGDAGARIGEIRQQKRMAERQANKPTAGLPKTSIKSEQNQQESAPLLRPEAVQNPEGGIPQMPEQTFSGRLEQGIRRDQAAQEKAQPAKRILSRIAELGGIDERHAGELQDVKDARRIGVIRKRAQMSPDVLARQLQSEGYHVDPENLDTLWEAARRDIAGRNERTANTGELNQRLANEEAAHYAKQEEAPEAAQAPADNATLYSAFRKLNTDDPAEISQMVRDADKRFKKSATTGEIAASRAAWEKVSQLTEAEQNALSSVLPERVFAPVKEEYQGEGNYSRAVSDFGNKETLGAQGEANYNEVMDFFDSLSAADKKITPQDVQAVRESLNRASWAKEHAQEHAKDIPALAVIAEGRDGESVRWMQLYDKLQSEGKLNATETGIFNQLGRQLGLSAKFIRGAVTERGRPARRSQEQAETPARSAQTPQGQSASPETNRRPEAARPARPTDTQAKIAEVDRQLGWDLISKEEAARQKARILKEAEAQPKARDIKANKFVDEETDSLRKEWSILRTFGDENLEGAVDNARVKTSVDPANKRAGIIYVNSNAKTVIDTIWKANGGAEFSAAVALDTPALEAVADVLRYEAGYLEGAQAKQVHALADAFSEMVSHKYDGAGLINVDLANSGHLELARNHEMFHVWQYGQSQPNDAARKPMDVEWAKKINGFEKVRASLTEKGYPDDAEDLVREFAAYSATNDLERLGFSKQEAESVATDFLYEYFNQISKQYGADHLERIGRISIPARAVAERVSNEVRSTQTPGRDTGESRTGQPATASPSRVAVSGIRLSGRPEAGGREGGEAGNPQEAAQKEKRFSFGELETEPRGQIAASGLGGLQNLFNRKPNAAKPTQATPLPKNWNLANWSQRFYREAMAAGLSNADRAKFDAAKTLRDKNAVLMGATIDPRHEQAVFDVIDKADNATTAKDGSALYDAMVDATNMLRHKPTERGYERFKKEAGSAISLPRALMASADISAPLRQGAILTLPPTQWGKAAKATVRMFESFSTKQYDRISKEINLHPDAETARDSGLYLSTDKSGLVTKKEEDFISHWADKIPIVKHSEQAYKAYLDSLRMDTFARYKKSIDKTKGLSAEQKDSAYKAAADWINVATGRGTLGKTFEDAMPVLSKVMFAPRYTASRIQVLNPMTYAKNARTAEGRAVLKNQMSDLVQYAGVISATLALAAANGAQVGLNPDDPDFLKIKVGNFRYDTLAGLQQPMRLFYRMGKSLYGRATGQKVNSRESALDIASRFGRSKLAPIPSFFVDYFSGRDFTGQPFKPSKAVIDRVVPLMWKDFYDAYQTEGLAGGLKTLPGATGIGVQNYGEKPGTLKPSAFTREASQMGKNFESIKPKANEPDDVFNARKQRVEGWMSTYGDKLINSPRYSLLTEDEKKAAIKLLRDRIGRQQNLKTPKLATFEPNAVLFGVKKSQANKPKQARKQLWTPQ